MSSIGDVAALEACLGKRSDSIDLKVIDHLDDGAQRWIAAAPLAFCAFAGVTGPLLSLGITLAGGAAGFARAAGPLRLALPLASLDAADLAVEGAGFAALFLVPGIGETLRVNGRVATVSAEAAEVAVEECYIHCAKALIRSEFWSAEPQEYGTDDPAAFLAESRFLALATVDDQGRADVSPKGDPAGTLIRLDGGVACYADRPGNRRADSFRNILAQPRVAAAALRLGSSRVATITGRARLSADDATRAAFAVNGKTPKLATLVDDARVTLAESPALARARLWPAAPRPDGLNAAAILAAHVKRNRNGGLAAGIVRAAVSLPGVLESELRRDYKNNLY